MMMRGEEEGNKASAGLVLQGTMEHLLCVIRYTTRSSLHDFSQTNGLEISLKCCSFCDQTGSLFRRQVYVIS